MSTQITPKNYKGELHIEGYVRIRNGSYDRTFKNHFVNNMLYTLVNLLAMASTNSVSSGVFYGFNSSGSTGSQFIVLGTDTTTATSFATTGLTSPIGTSPGTLANIQTGTTNTFSNGAAVILTAVWLPGTVSGTVGEVGLYGYSSTALVTFGSGMDFAAPTFISRLSVKDSDFTAFAITTTAPLTVDWTIQFTFA